MFLQKYEENLKYCKKTSGNVRAPLVEGTIPIPLMEPICMSGTYRFTLHDWAILRDLQV